MLDFQQKRKVRGFMYHKATLVVLFLLVLVLARSTWIVFEKKRESEAMKNISLQNVEALRSRDADLQSKIQALDTDAGVEAEIRSKFSVMKGGENMVMVVDDPDFATSTPVQAPSFWTGFKAFFGFK